MTSGPTSTNRSTGGADPDASGTPDVTLDDVREAARRLAGAAHRTPVLRSRTLDARTGTQAFLARELPAGRRLQVPRRLPRPLPPHPRGARGRRRRLPSGNHAQAVALAARERGTRAVIVMPADAPRSKRTPPPATAPRSSPTTATPRTASPSAAGSPRNGA
ncbi:hypothetical protein O1L55_23240 [Streptomyces albulus]|nr:hypothetical protein [Streptomyces noursei]